MTTQSPKPSGVFNYFQLPDTFAFVSLYSADGYIELLKFVHNDVVQLPNKKRKIVAELQVVNEGEYYVVTLNWQNFPQQFATASAFVFDNPDDEGCEIRGYAELTSAIPIFGLLLFAIALIAHLITGVGFIAFVVAFIAYILATRGALKWRNTLIQHLFHIAQIIPEPQRDTISETEFDERVEQLVKGIKQGA